MRFSKETPEARVAIVLAESTSSTPSFKAHIRKTLKDGVYEKEIARYVEAAMEKKDNFLLVSAATDRRIKKAAWARKYNHNEETWAALLNEEMCKKIEAYITAVDADVISTNQHLKVLVEQSPVRLNKHWKESKRLRRLVAQMQSSLIILREQTNQIIGMWINKMGRFGRQWSSDWAYIDLLIRRCKNPQRARLSLFRDRQVNAENQEDFREEVLNAYGTRPCEKPHGQYQESWCCIDGSWEQQPYNPVVEARLVPYHIGEAQARHLFGPAMDEDGHLMSPKCALSVCAHYEWYLDYSIAFKPVENSDDIQIVVLHPYQSCLDHIDGKIMTFHNEFRPAKRYLYFAFATALLWSENRSSGLVAQAPGTRTEGDRGDARSEAVEFVGLDADHPYTNPGTASQADDVQDILVSDYVSVSLYKHPITRLKLPEDEERRDWAEKDRLGSYEWFME
ncbi:hypothetical protein QBC33DRAFT_607196 [Phialemonium atrogriseum]|uniref:Uncharacterized protein n=1 Tax=Phialemonium atrogriseum TaxID=1093897 RepID=A0AAJ0FPX5_9PEZI|nr:uncharacterized protein QBC33DRAFT_607196 [Phialemonium atrogriseum]KAK1768585.1 hypothetical protein QBC33DRAFT_607196 [Phialemonium atrogriseum]